MCALDVKYILNETVRRLILVHLTIYEIRILEGKKNMITTDGMLTAETPY